MRITLGMKDFRVLRICIRVKNCQIALYLPKIHSLFLFNTVTASEYL